MLKISISVMRNIDGMNGMADLQENFNSCILINVFG